MAFYQNGNILQHITNAAFDAIHKPGESVPYSGIYHCEHCNEQIVSTFGNPFPPQNHHQHDQSQPIRWRLIVIPKHNQQK